MAPNQIQNPYGKTREALVILPQFPCPSPLPRLTSIPQTHQVHSCLPSRHLLHLWLHRRSPRSVHGRTPAFLLNSAPDRAACYLLIGSCTPAAPLIFLQSTLMARSTACLPLLSRPCNRRPRLSWSSLHPHLLDQQETRRHEQAVVKCL